MIFALVQMSVENFDKFWTSFQSRAFALRQAHGSLGAHVFYKSEEAHSVIILFQWESQKRMEAYFENSLVLESLARDGVNSGPTILYMTKAGELEA